MTGPPSIDRRTWHSTWPGVLCLTVALIGALTLSACAPEGAHDYNEGIERFKQGDYAGAATALRKAVENNADFAEAYHSLGVCLIEIEDFDGAARAFERAQQLLEEGKAVETDDGRTLMAKRALVHRHLGLIEEHRYARTMMRDHEAAVRHLRKAHEQYKKAQHLDASEPHSKQRLAQIEELLQRLEK